MHFSTTLLLGSGLVSLAVAQYSLADDYSGSNFFKLMTFDTEDDPTHGYVNYVDQATAKSDGLVNVNNGVVTIKSDSTNVASGRGRNSVRVTSTKQYTHGLVVLDLEHMPGSACGIWPAFWMTGPSWPNNGEIDIIEGVNYQSQNSMTMHTNAGCSMVNANCQGNQGCGVQAGGGDSFGDGFNDAKGGVYAMEWTSSAINVWFFSRSNVPSGISGSSPDPSSWGNPTASFVGGTACDIDQHFQNNNIVFDTTFCGDWAGSVWSQTSTCSAKAATCQDYVQNNPSAFASAYWTINSLKVYTSGGNSTPALISTNQPSSSQAAAPPITSTASGAVAAGLSSTAPVPSSVGSSPTSAASSTVSTTSTSSTWTPAATSTATPSPSSSSISASLASISSAPVGVGSTQGGTASEQNIPPQQQGDAFEGHPADGAQVIGSTQPYTVLGEHPVSRPRSLAEVVGASPAPGEKRAVPRMMRHLRRHHKLSGHA